MSVSKESEKILSLWKENTQVAKPAEQPNFKVIDQIAGYFSPGSFFYYIFDFSQFQLRYIHPTVGQILGMKAEDFTLEKYLASVHPEDVPVVSNKEQHASWFIHEFLKPKQMLDYKVSYTLRVKRTDGRTIVILSQATALNYTEEGRVGHVLCVQTDISHMKQSSDNLISFIHINGGESFLNLDVDNFSLNQKQISDSILTKTELETLRLISYGKSAEKIAKIMTISVDTVRTHRKNMLGKEDVGNMTELVAKYIRSGMV